MTVYGLTRAARASSRHRGSPGRNDLQAFAAVQLPVPVMLDEPLGTSGRSVDVRHRTEGRWLLLHAQAGNVLVVTKLDRLGRACQGTRSASGASRTCSSWPTLLRSPSGWARARTCCSWWRTSGGVGSRTIAGCRGARFKPNPARERATALSGSGEPGAGFTA